MKVAHHLTFGGMTLFVCTRHFKMHFMGRAYGELRGEARFLALQPIINGLTHKNTVTP
jgi:hypothetical protein